MSFVLAIAVGPVQDFIAAARKTRDLWYGSQMLSDLSREVAKCVRSCGAELIFPESSALDNNRICVANKIVAIVDPGKGKSPDEIAAEARQAANGYIQGLWQKAAGGNDHLLDSSRAEKQIEGFLEFYAAWWPINKQYSYDKARKQADLLLAGRKALRDFQPAPGEQNVPKSSLDPGRETVLVEGREQDRAKLGIKPKETLDAISFTKRVTVPKRFVSVSRVAMDPWIRRLGRDNPDGLNELCTLAGTLAASPAVQQLPQRQLPHYDAFPFDIELVYGSREGDREMRTWLSQHPQHKKTLDELQALVRQLCERMGGLHPPAYLAVLAADGDRMGAAISRITTPAAHQAFSKALSGFASKADDIVQEHNGAMVYSGGDDVLAFLPLDTCLACAQKLNEAFHDALDDAVDKDSVPTLSVGIAIAHYSEHLQEMVKWARDAERLAKRERNSLAVAMHTRTAGPEAVEVCRQWTDDPVGHIQCWVDAHRLDLVPDSAAFQLRALHRELERAPSGVVAKALAPEVARILKRRRAGHGRDEMQETLQTIARNEATSLPALSTLLNEMLIARRLADVQDVAGVPMPNAITKPRGANEQDS